MPSTAALPKPRTLTAQPDSLSLASEWRHSTPRNCVVRFQLFRVERSFQLYVPKLVLSTKPAQGKNTWEKKHPGLQERQPAASESSHSLNPTPTQNRSPTSKTGLLGLNVKPFSRKLQPQILILRPCILSLQTLNPHLSILNPPQNPKP